MLPLKDVCASSGTQEVPLDAIDSCFRAVSKNSVCFQIWKVNEDNVEVCPKQQYGTFIDDCAYIICAICPQGEFVTQNTITRDLKSKTIVEYYIHFWLGDNVNEKKRSNVACKIQELDTYLNNRTIEYRETQHYESPRFLSYFKNGIIIKSGFLINTTDVNRLYKLYGRKSLYCVEMKSISWEHFSSDYIMILNTMDHMFIWNGRSTSNMERCCAIELAAKFRKNSNQITITDDGYEQTMPENRREEWNKFLPLDFRTVCQNSITLETLKSTKIKIYKCCHRNNRLHLDELNAPQPSNDIFNDSTAVYVLDVYVYGVWIWVGSQVSHYDKISAMGNGRAFVKKRRYPHTTSIIRVVEGYEPPEFLKLFSLWYTNVNDAQMASKVKPTILGSFDSITLCQRPKMAAESQLIDDGTGERKIYYFTKDQIIDVTASKATCFLTNSSYVVQYSINTNSMSQKDAESVGVNEVIYQWNGIEASTEIIGKAEKFARNIFDTDGKYNMLVQMRETDETPHFLQIFHGKFIVLRNEKNTRNQNNNTEYSRDNFILKVHGDTSYNGKAVEVSPLTVNMNSKECYIIQTNQVWVWCGQNSTGDTREISKNIGSTLGDYTLVLEHKEPEEFWKFLTNIIPKETLNNCSKGRLSPISSINGNNKSNNVTNTGIKQYNCTSSNLLKFKQYVQLFLIWGQRGKFYSQEIVGFQQSSLSPECVYILDAVNIVFVWVGEYASTYEKEKYLSMAQNYFETYPLIYRTGVAIAIIRQHNEPNIFKGFFNDWDHDYWQNYVSYCNKRQLMSQELSSGTTYNKSRDKNSVNDSNALVSSLLNSQKDFDRHQKYPVKVLQQDIDILPAEINPLKREVHLTHDDFVSLFNMSFWEFDELPLWKQHELKKKNKLF